MASRSGWFLKQAALPYSSQINAPRGSRIVFNRCFCKVSRSGSGSDTKLRRIPSFRNVSRPSGSGMKTAEDAVNNILYNMPLYKPSEKRHVLSVFVDNEIGVLSKVSGLLSARGFNIDSLSVSRTDVTDLSRMTIVLKGPDEQIEQAKRQLEDLCDIWAVFDYKASENTFERELCLVKVNCIPPQVDPEDVENMLNTEHDTVDEINSAATGTMSEASRLPAASYEEMMSVHFHRQAVMDVAKLFGGKVSDVGSEHIIIELVSWPARVEAFLKMLQPFGIVEAARTGVIAMGKSKVAGFEEVEQSLAKKVDLADLPPS